MNPDDKLTDHFTFGELTVTSHLGLQEENRREAQAFLPALQATAALLERLRAYLGAPIRVHSGFRCPALNGALAGSAPKSQHMLGQAADFTCPDKFQEDDHGNAGLYAAVRDFMKTRNAAFGQLIDEGCPRAYPSDVWCHLSLGAPWRDPLRCGQLLKMRDGQFTSLGSIPQP